MKKKIENTAAAIDACSTNHPYKPSLVRIDARNFDIIVVTDPQTLAQTNKPTDRTDYNTLCR